MTEWSPEDIKAHIEFQQALNAELAELGELVDAQGLAGPELAKFVVSDGTSAPLTTTGCTRCVPTSWSRGDGEAAIAEFRAAAARTANLRGQQYLTTKAARPAAGR